MKIEIDEETLREAVVQSTNKAVQGALESYQIEAAIRDRVVDSVLGDAIAETVSEAIEQVDRNALRESLSRELARTVVATATHVLEEACISVIVGMQGIPSYNDTAIASARAKIEQQMFARGTLHRAPCATPKDGEPSDDNLPL